MRDGFEWLITFLLGVLIALACSCSPLEPWRIREPKSHNETPGYSRTNPPLGRPITSQIMPPMTWPQPSFKILRIRDQPHEVLHESAPTDVVKCYVLEVESDGGIWRLVVDQNNRTIFQRFALN